MGDFLIYSLFSFLRANTGAFGAVYAGTSKEDSVIMEEAQKLISDGLESKLHSVLLDLLSSNPPENMVSSLVFDSNSYALLFMYYSLHWMTCTRYVVFESAVVVSLHKRSR